MFLSPGYAPNLSAYLFGSILTVSETDILFMAILTFTVLVVYVLFRRLIVYTAFDRDYAITQGLPVRFIEYLMSILIAATIVLSIRLVGIMLLLSLLTVPQMIANMFTADYGKITFSSCIIAFVGCVAGLFLSYYFGIPSGAFIVLTLLTVMLTAKGFRNCSPLLIKKS
jgi:zinc transport system permease protein